MNKIFAYILFLGTIVQVSGQSSDILMWEKDTLNLYSNPLKKGADWQKINQSISEQILDKQLSTNNDSTIEISPFLQNYKTEWKIEKGKLYLTNIKSYQANVSKLDLTIISQNGKFPIFANWLTDELIIFNGNCIVCTSNHLTKTSIYPNELILEFKNGVLISKVNYKNRFLKKSKLSDLDPSQYLEYIYCKIDWSELNDLYKTYQVFVSIEPDKNGKMKKIDWDNTYLIVDNKIITDKKNKYIEEAIRIAKSIPDWNVILRHERIMNQSLSIVFSQEMKEKYAR